MQEIKVSSTGFFDGGSIPAKYTCDGANISPPLAWSAVPDGTKGITVICEDPDAPHGTFVHWMVINLPSGTTHLDENVPTKEKLANGTYQLMNDARKVGYTGPCPPSGTHRYYFRVYALNTELHMGQDAKRVDLLKAMEGHILGEGEIMGRYSRGK